MRFPWITEEDTGTVFRDVIFLVMLMFVLLFVSALVHVNPVNDKNENTTNPPGNISITIFWDNDLDADVDLWVKAPNDLPVGYSRKSGKLFNLLRDDLGKAGDVTNTNFENAFSRGVVEGEYIVNLHLYQTKDRLETPIEVSVVVTVTSNTENGPDAIDVIKTVAYLHRKGQEITVARFKLDKEGQPIPGTLSNIFSSLRRSFGI